MWTIQSLAIVIGTMLALLLPNAPAQPQATRTWVSGVGDNANPCTRTAPCKTFAGAISKTAKDGCIDCLDPGGFGALTITKAITTECDQEIGHVLVAGTNGIVVNAPAGSNVTLRGLSLQGIGSGLNGISFVGGGTLHVQETIIHDSTQSGISFAPNSGTASLYVFDETLIHDNNGGNVSSAGILIKPTNGARANVTINGVQLENHAIGISADGSVQSSAAGLPRGLIEAR